MIEKTVADTIKEFGMLSGNRRITVALSGGADSVCLLHIMLSLSARLGAEITAAHLNHCIRGEEALRDEEFVKRLCKGLNVPLFCERANVPAYAEKNKLSLELAAREVRYEFLNRVSAGGLIATAHNADDNLETLIFNLSRGTALKGLCGIPPVRDNIIRPLIRCSRAQIEAYCEKRGLSFVTDSTNLSDDYTRNKIRHKIIPVLREINPAVEEAAYRACQTLSIDNSFIEKTASTELKSRAGSQGCISVKGFDRLDKAVAFRVLKCFCEDVGINELSHRHLNQLYSVCLTGGECCLPEKILVCTGDILTVKGEEAEKPEFLLSFSDEKPENFLNTKKINNLLLKNYLDCDKIVGKLVERTRQSGDAVRLKNKNGTKSLKKLYTEYRIPIELRDIWPVLSDDSGIVWIYKIGVAERCAADENSSNIIKINVTERFGDNNDRI